MFDNPVIQKSKEFALEIINLADILQDSHEFVFYSQILRSGTSIGANIREAIYAQSKPDFISKLQIAQKEASETLYWLELLHESNRIKKEQFDSLYPKCDEILRLLSSIIISTKRGTSQKKSTTPPHGTGY